MTLDRLKNLYHLQSEIDLLQTRIDALKDEAEQITQTLSDMPKGRTDDKLGRLVAAYSDLEQILIVMKERQICEQCEIEEYITTIPDSRTRMIMHLRFVERLKYDDIAARIGVYETAENCRQIVCRYLKNNL